MQSESFFYNCSSPYLNSISLTLHDEMIRLISSLPKRSTQTEVNKDLFWQLTSDGWSYDSLSGGIESFAPSGLNTPILSLEDIKQNNKRSLCLTSTTIDAKWHSDFAKLFGDKLVQIEAQFGKVESMFKDFCGFKICAYERRLALGIEIVFSEPSLYFSHRRAAISGMAYFDIAKKTLPAIELDCPIWLIGIKE
jgi:hypothetical protein